MDMTLCRREKYVVVSASVEENCGGMGLEMICTVICRKEFLVCCGSPFLR